MVLGLIVGNFRNVGVRRLTPQPTIGDGMNAVSAGRCKKWDVFLHCQFGRTQRNFTVDHVDVLRAVMREVKARHPFTADGGTSA